MLYGDSLYQSSTFLFLLFNLTGSKYRDPISETILKLQKSQVLEQLKFYWWRKHDIEKPCDTSPTKSSDANSLGVEKVGGCFVMLLIGMVVSLLVGLLEFVCNAYRRVATKKVGC